MTSTPVPTPTSTACVSSREIICVTGSEAGVPVVMIFIIIAGVCLIIAGVTGKRK